MFEFLSKFFLKKHISLYSAIPLSACKVQKPYLLERAGITSGTVVMIAVPYFTKSCMDPTRNISCYAVSRDYHIFFKELFDELLPLLQQTFPQFSFAGFTDHSPIAEVDAAARAGLGRIGDNHLLITERHSSFVFLGCLITNAELPSVVHPILQCEHCGKCKQICLAQNTAECLSNVTQKKGILSESEIEMLLQYRSAWGCDLCQFCCPHTAKAMSTGSIYTEIDYFKDKTIAYLTTQAVDQMSDTAFSERAYAWRKKDTIQRNLILLEAHRNLHKGEEKC